MGMETAREDTLRAKVRKPEPEGTTSARASAPRRSGITDLQQRVGNRAVQRLLAQRISNEPVPVDDDIVAQIDGQRGAGQPLESALQTQAGEALGHDMSAVRVHTSPEADALARSLSANAFTTGNDIFFRSGAYQPHSAVGRDLIHHELAHVVQQGTGAVNGGASGMVVNPPGDAFEREADAVASSLAGEPAAQRQEAPEEEEEIQARATFQRQEYPEEEEIAQAQPMPEDEAIQASWQAGTAQRQAGTEEEELQRQAVSVEDEDAALRGREPGVENQEEATAQRQHIPEEGEPA